MIIFAITNKENGEVRNFRFTESIYDYIVEEIFNGHSSLTEEQHKIAADAEGWCELASVGEIYEDDKFEIEVAEWE